MGDAREDLEAAAQDGQVHQGLVGVHRKAGTQRGRDHELAAETRHRRPHSPGHHR